MVLPPFREECIKHSKHPKEIIFLSGNDIPNIDTMIEWSLEMVNSSKTIIPEIANGWIHLLIYPSGHLGLVTEDGGLELYDGYLRAIDSKGEKTLDDIAGDQYFNYFNEGVEKWSYMKFPYLKALGMMKAGIG